MNCTQAQHELLTAENLADPALPADLLTHLRDCAECTQTLARLRRLEVAARDLPTPSSTNARSAFLSSLETPDPIAFQLPHQPVSTRSFRWRAIAVAALLLLAVGLAVWSLTASDTGRAEAADATVDRLIDWNLNLADAGTPEERTQIYNANAPSLRQAVDSTTLPADQKELATKLLQNGSWLSSNTDPLASAEHFDEVADLVLRQLDTATAIKQAKAISKLTHRYERVVTRGIDLQLKRTKPAHLKNPDRSRRYERLLQKNEQLNRRLQQLQQGSTRPSRKEQRREFGLTPTSKLHRVRRTFALCVSPTMLPILAHGVFA